MEIKAENYKDLIEYIQYNYDEICLNTENIKRIWNKAGNLGVMDMNNTMKTEEICSSLANNCLMDFPFWLQKNVINHLFIKYATPQQKAKYLKLINTGENIFALAMTESNGGSDFKNIQTNVVKDENNKIILNGTKKYISCGCIADVLLVTAVDRKNKINIYIVDSNADGVQVEQMQTHNCINALNFAQITFNNVKINIEDKLGSYQDSTLILFDILSIERYCCCLMNYYSIRKLFSISSEWAKTRKAGNSCLYESDYVKFALVDFYTDIQLISTSINELVKDYNTNKKLDVKTTALVKYRTSNLLIDLSQFTIRIMGAAAFTNMENNIVKYLNSGLAYSIAGGTNEIMKKIISRWV